MAFPSAARQKAGFTAPPAALLVAEVVSTAGFVLVAAATTAGVAIALSGGRGAALTTRLERCLPDLSPRAPSLERRS